MKLVIEYDPWHEGRLAKGAVAWLERYSITAELREIKLGSLAAPEPTFQEIVAGFKKSKKEENDKGFEAAKEPNRI